MNTPTTSHPKTLRPNETDRVPSTASAILDSLGLAVFLVDAGDVVTYLNKPAVSLLRLLGVCREAEPAIIGASWAELFAGPGFPGWQGIPRSIPYGTNADATQIVRFEESDSIRHFAVAVEQFIPDDRSATSRIVCMREVTNILANQQKKADLQAAAERGSLLSWITHDMNNFLGMILGGVEIAQINLGKGNLDKVTATLEKLKGNVGKAEQFTSALAESTRMETRRALLDLNDVVSGTVAFARAQKKFSRVELCLSLDRNLPPFNIDSNQIALLLLSLLDNGADAIIESGRADGVIIVTTLAADNSVCLTISDNGVGIPANIKDRLFRAHLTTKPNARGYGLVNCARIIMNHDASFTVSSEPGQGATFAFTFPLHPVDRTQGSDGKS